MSKTFNVIINNKSQTVFHGLYTFIDYRNDIKMFKTLQWNHNDACDSWFQFHCLPVRDTHKNQGPGVMGYQYIWFLFPEIPPCQTTKNLYLSSYAKCSIPEILEIKWCILTGKRYLIYCTSIKLLASRNKQKCEAFFLTSMVRKVSTLKLMGHSILIFGNVTHVHISIQNTKEEAKLDLNSLKMLAWY